MTPGGLAPRALLPALLVAYVVVGLFYAWTLENHDYETEYLALGKLVVRGELNLYADDLRGHWPPLPFFVYGLPQAVFGPSLLGGRLLAVALGAIVFGLVFHLATRWAGALAGAVAAALFCSHGFVMGYYATVHFAGLVALVHVIGLAVLFATDWPRRELVAMAVFSVLFLVKNNFWPTVPFVLLYLLWRVRAPRERLLLVAIAVALPVAFFLWDDRHLKMLAYVPVLQHWVEPLGYRPWYLLTEDAGQIAAGEYAAIPWELSLGGRLGAIAGALVFLLKRYAAWLAVLVVAAIAVWRARRTGRLTPPWHASAVGFTFWLFCYLVAFQFVILGPYAKQAVGFVGAVAPLLAIVLGALVGVAVRDATSPAMRLAPAVLAVIAVLVSPWIHRQHNLPRRIALDGTPVVVLGRVADRLRTLLPAGETRVFALADPMALHLADRRAYIRQFNQERWGFTTIRDRTRYQRVGMWGLAELEEWLTADARYAVVETDIVRFYGNRVLYRPVLARMDALLARHFTLVAEIPAGGDDRYLVYRRSNLTGSVDGRP